LVVGAGSLVLGFFNYLGSIIRLADENENYLIAAAAFGLPGAALVGTSFYLRSKSMKSKIKAVKIYNEKY
jgi:hypothetical protein